MRRNNGRLELVRWSVWWPLLLCLLCVALALLFDYPGRSYGHERYLLSSNRESARRAVTADLESTIQAGVEQLGRQPKSPETTRLEPVYLFVDASDLEESILRKKFYGGKDWSGLNPQRFNAFFRAGTDPMLECRASIRGYSSWHFQKVKPSFRLRFSKKGDSPGFRWLELSRPEDALALANRFPDSVAQAMGVMNNRLNWVRLFLNRQDKGVYIESLRPGSRLALENGKLPGTFFKGDGLELRQTVWEVPSAWDIEGEKGPEVQRWFEDFLKLVAQTGQHPARRGELSRFVDEEALAKAVAVYLFCGSVHADDRHNQLFYLSSYDGRLQPVLWDANGMGLLGGASAASAHPDVYLNQLVALASWEPEFLHRRNLWLYELATDSRYEELLSSEIEQLKGELETDPALHQIGSRDPKDLGQDYNLGGVVMAADVPASELGARRQEVRRWLEQRRARLKSYLADARVALQEREGKLRVASFGEVAVKAERLDGSRVLLLYPGRERRFVVDAGAPGAAYTPSAPLFYTLEGGREEWRFSNSLDGTELEPELRLPEQPASLYSLPCPPKDLNAAPKELQLGPGLVELEKDLFLPADSHLTVLPGTHLRLADGVSVVSRGKVTMEGTAEQPIRVDSPGHFGSFSLVGEGTAGSTLRYVSVSSGTTARFGALHLKGMFNVYGCPDLSLVNCRFENNSVGDDTVNLGLSKVLVKGCVFEGAPMDALDLDGCRAEISDCRFLGAGNDGLDIMETDLVLSACRFVDCGDKGVSIGEECRSVLKDSVFSQCATGLELKDSSRTEAEGCDFERCKTAVRGYRKKWLFRTGGLGALRSCELKENDRDLDIQPTSQLWLFDTSAQVPQGQQSRVHLGGVFELGPGPSVRTSRASF